MMRESLSPRVGFGRQPESWTTDGMALDRIGFSHPAQLTTEVVFRLWPSCGERNIVKDDWYYCTMCDARLPQMETSLATQTWGKKTMHGSGEIERICKRKSIVAAA